MQGEPPVKYRGIFINDEEPALGCWAVANYKGFTSDFYKKVFELALRMCIPRMLISTWLFDYDRHGHFPS